MLCPCGFIEDVKIGLDCGLAADFSHVFILTIVYFGATLLVPNPAPPPYRFQAVDDRDVTDGSALMVTNQTTFSIDNLCHSEIIHLLANL